MTCGKTQGTGRFSAANAPFIWLVRLKNPPIWPPPPALPSLDAAPPFAYTSAVPPMDQNYPPGSRAKAARGGELSRISDHVAALRTDRQGPPDRPHGEPLEHQDQAQVPAQPLQRHLHLRHPRPQRPPPRLHQRDQERGSPRRAGRVPAEGEGDRAVAKGAGAEARDREEEGGGRGGEEGGVRLARSSLGRVALLTLSCLRA